MSQFKNWNRPLFWHQGVFLQPQHFQMSDIHNQSLMAPYNKYIQTFMWGVANIDLPDTITGQTFDQPSYAELLFRDLTYTILPENALIQPRSFEEEWIEEGKPFTVYIGLKKWNFNGENVTIVSDLNSYKNVSTRFVTTSEFDTIPDMHQGKESGDVRRLYYNLRYFWETEIDDLGDYELIPIVQLERIADEVRLSEQFIAPCISIHASTALAKIIKEIKNQIASRCFYLESFKVQRGIHSAEFGSRDMTYMLALRSLNRYVPLLFHMTEIREVHPEKMYAALRQIVGELTTFSEHISVLGEDETGNRLVPTYDHNNLWFCFHAVQSTITRLIDYITAGPEYVVELKWDGSFFSTNLKPDIFEGFKNFYIAFKTRAEHSKIRPQIESIAKLSSKKRLPQLITNALPGVPLEYLQVPPQELPRRPNSMYFQINHHSKQWEAVKDSKNVALYWNESPEDIYIEMMVVGSS